MAMSCIAPCAPNLPSALPVHAPIWAAVVTPATPLIDTEFEARCDDVNGDGSLIRPYWVVMRYNESTGALVSVATVDDTGAAYAPANPVACPADTEFDTVRLCFRETASPAVTVWRTDIINPRLSTVVASFWQDEAGTIIAAPAAALTPCNENADRVYAMRTSGMQAATFAVPAPAAPAAVRSVTLLVSPNSRVRLDNGPDAGAEFPAGSYSWSAPVAAPGAERGALSFLPQFTPLAGTFMVNYVTG